MWVKLLGLGPQEMELPTNMASVKYDSPKTNEYLHKMLLERRVSVWKWSLFRWFFAKIFQGGCNIMVPIFGYDTLPVFTKMPVEMGGESEDLRADAQGWALKKSPPKPWELTNLLDPFETVPSVAARFRNCVSGTDLQPCESARIFLLAKWKLLELEKLCEYNMWLICKVFNHVEFRVNDKATPDFWICSNLSFGTVTPDQELKRNPQKIVYFFQALCYFSESVTMSS